MLQAWYIANIAMVFFLVASAAQYYTKKEFKLSIFYTLS